MFIPTCRLVILIALGLGANAYADSSADQTASLETTDVASEPAATPKLEATHTAALEAAEAPVDVAPTGKVKKRARPYVTHANFGLLAMNWQGATADKPSNMTTAADRQVTLQMFGVGRFVTPKLRVMLSMQLAENVGGAPEGTPTLGMVGIVPWLGYHPAGPLFVGAGPLIAPRIYGKNQLDLGVFTAAGVTFPLGNGFAAGASVQIPVMLLVKTAVSVAPAGFLAYRF